MGMNQEQRILAVARLGQLSETAQRRRASLDEHQAHCGACGQETTVAIGGVNAADGLPDVKTVMVFCLAGLELVRRYTGSKAVLDEFQATVDAWRQGDKTPGGSSAPGGIILPD